MSEWPGILFYWLGWAVFTLAQIVIALLLLYIAIRLIHKNFVTLRYHLFMSAWWWRLRGDRETMRWILGMMREKPRRTRREASDE